MESNNDGLENSIESTINQIYEYNKKNSDQIENLTLENITDEKDQEIDPLEILNNDDDDDDDESILDTSWMNDIEKYHQISTNKERELTDSIGCYFIYINKNLYIEKILSEKCPLEIDSENGVSILPNKTVLKMVQDKKMLTPVSKYKLIDILSFVVDIEPEKVQIFSKNSDNNDDCGRGFFKVLPIVNDIRIDKSIFIFHNVNHLYFIFQEVENSHHHRSTLKSILKKTVGGTLKNQDTDENLMHNNTKKVRIITEPRELATSSRRKHRFTKKNYTIPVKRLIIS